MPGVSAGSASSTVFSASVPPVEAPITTTFSVVSAMACVAGERIASAVSLGSTVWLGRRVRSLAAAAAFTASQSVDARVLKKLLGAQPRLGDDLHRAVFERSECALRALFGQTRTDHHRNRMLAHDLLEEGEPIHARHLDVERDHVRHSARRCGRPRQTDRRPWRSPRSPDRTRARRAASAEPRRSRPRSEREFLDALRLTVALRPFGAAGGIPASDALHTSGFKQAAAAALLRSRY